MAPTNPFHDSQTTTTANNVHPSNGLPEDQIPSEPPPAYTPSATTGTGESTVQAGPLRPDFSGPPPMPDWVERQQQQQQQYTGGSGVGVNLTGVGMGYGHGGQAHSQGQYANGNSSSNETKPPPPPRHPSVTSSSARPPPPLPSRDSTTQPSSSQSAAPTEAPTPGRPLLHRGQMLVYPGGFWCSKCNNTGYKANDPSNPHERDWKKYGRVYNSTLAHSYTQALSAGLQMSDNFQKPLPSYAPAGHAPASVPYSGPTSAQYSHLPPPPGSSGKWSTYPGQGQGPGQSYSHLPPPPQRQQQLQYPAPGQQIFVQRTAGMAPPGALVVAPGDPRIGGRLCWRCNGSGTEILFFGFDEGRCSTCSGLGRLF
ncbi:hypothetical protein L202_04330 [Cryptococcus amylolentus CBS 6039]|uniref:Uncharacterized protein n=1 Tax=Cryptococcus amylolentus CBS 6039 TaxID=1295533 RepID=A0A1E3HQX5_9TREE|nr:hypothetical protein L202_04330 [Cryptococcus amylolentus CBS 6039]ODN78769.1 hypothetical protein L202_04330 [Cryptococcus amylolentus CBS 6039]